ncbi:MULTISPECIES: ribosomal maturation YjgA family protein [unclassified Bacillus (in: firmicutes)]|uniref:ribosomal maturation YjgA family protein n=1 Tax=unclassified Bacillus (in: firmicutes) TaxID=185979 RepID=UPI00404221B2
MNTKRNRVVYALFTIVIIILGLSSRKFAFALPHLLNDYLGDALWALMIFTGFGLLFPKTETKKLAFISLMFCYGIEASQLYHAEWIDSMRATTLGGLVLGYGFLWSDLVAYTIGVGVGVLCEVIFRKT